jgi:hypothetical protein
LFLGAILPLFQLILNFTIRLTARLANTQLLKYDAKLKGLSLAQDIINIDSYKDALLTDNIKAVHIHLALIAFNVAALANNKAIAQGKTIVTTNDLKEAWNIRKQELKNERNFLIASKQCAQISQDPETLNLFIQLYAVQTILSKTLEYQIIKNASAPVEKP